MCVLWIWFYDKACTHNSILSIKISIAISTLSKTSISSHAAIQRSLLVQQHCLLAILVSKLWPKWQAVHNHHLQTACGVFAKGWPTTFHCCIQYLHCTFHCLNVSPRAFMAERLGSRLCFLHNFSCTRRCLCVTLQHSEQKISVEVLCALNIQRRNTVEWWGQQQAQLLIKKTYNHFYYFLWGLWAKL